MLRRILTAGARALGASFVLGCLLAFALGGPDSPHASQIVGISVICFFISWPVFTVLSPQPPEHTDIDRAGE